MLPITKKERIEQLEQDVSDLRKMVFDLANKLDEKEREEQKKRYFG